MTDTKLTRRALASIFGLSLTTSCGKDRFDWTQVRYGGKMYRIYTRKEDGKVEINVYEEDPNAAPGTSPWKSVADKDQALDMLARQVIVDRGTGVLPNLKAEGPRAAVVTGRPRIYVLDVYGQDRVIAMDGDTLERLGVVPTQQTGLVGMEISPDQKQLYVAIRAQAAFGSIPARPAAIQILTANPLALSRRIDLPSTVSPRLVNQALVISPDGATLYLVNEGPFTPPVGFTASTLVRIDVASGRITGELGGLQPGRAYGSLVRSADGRMLYALVSSGVAFIDLASFSLMTIIPVSGRDMEIHPDGSRLYISTSFPPRVQVVDTIAARLLTPIDLAPTGEVDELEITSDGRFLFAHYALSGSLYVVDLERGLKVDEFPGPPGIARIGLGG
ncbi:MAG: hypothetical protein OHK0021_12450 [Bryobacter sp.]